jgi:hypothetical protein
VPAARPPLPKIALKDAFAHKHAMTLDQNKNPDWDRRREDLPR